MVMLRGETAAVPAPGPGGSLARASSPGSPGSIERAGATPPSDADDRMQQLYQTHAPALYRFLLRLTFGERQAAEDLLR